jgi:hypothetical protein
MIDTEIITPILVWTKDPAPLAATLMIFQSYALLTALKTHIPSKLPCIVRPHALVSTLQTQASTNVYKYVKLKTYSLMWTVVTCA